MSEHLWPHYSLLAPRQARADVGRFQVTLADARGPVLLAEVLGVRADFTQVPSPRPLGKVHFFLQKEI